MKKQKIDARKFTDNEFIALTNEYSLKKIINLFLISPQQAVKFVAFNETYSWGVDDSYVGFENIVSCQSHITMEDLIQEQKKLNSND